MKQLTNPIFLNNCTDPVTKKIVKEIRRYAKYNHDKSEKWDMIWQYYRDRNRKSVETIYRENKGKTLKIIFSGDPTIYKLECPVMEKKSVDKYAHLKHKETNIENSCQSDD